MHTLDQSLYPQDEQNLRPVGTDQGYDEDCPGRVGGEGSTWCPQTPVTVYMQNRIPIAVSR